MANYKRWWEWGIEYSKIVGRGDEAFPEPIDTEWDDSLHNKPTNRWEEQKNQRYWEALLHLGKDKPEGTEFGVLVLRCRVMNEWDDIEDEDWLEVNEDFTLDEYLAGGKIKIPRRFHNELKQLVKKYNS